MSRNRPPRQSRREREERSQRTERLVVGGAIAVLAVAAVVVVAGLILTEYLPPRAHVLTVGDQDYDAAAYLRRARYEVLRGATTASATSGDPAVTDTVGLIRDGEVVRLRAADEVGEVTDEDLDARLRENLGFVDSDDETGFADAYTDLLRALDLGRDEYEYLLRIDMLRERLRERFREEVTDGVEQVRVSRLRVVTESQAADAQERLADGEEFATVAEELGSDAGADGSDGDPDWQPLESLSPAAREAIASLEAGEVSGIVDEGLFFDLYLLAEREERPLEEEQVAPVVEARLLGWVEARRDSVVVELDMSSGERDWIDDELTEWLGGLLSGR